MNGRVRAAGLLGATAAAGWFLLHVGDGALGVPVGSPRDLAAWADRAEAALVAMAVLRFTGLALCVYLLAVLTTILVASVRSGARSPAAAGWLPSVVRRALLGGAGVGLAAGAAVPALPARAAAQDVTGATGGDEATASMVKLAPGETEPPEAGPSPPGSDVTGASAPEPSGADDRDPDDTDDRDAVAARPETWRVAGGDSFWSIAAEVLAGEDTGGELSSDTFEVGRYWHALVDANRDNLVDPDNPDLLLPGQELRLPAR